MFFSAWGVKGQVVAAGGLVAAQVGGAEPRYPLLLPGAVITGTWSQGPAR